MMTTGKVRVTATKVISKNLAMLSSIGDFTQPIRIP